jgi:hypothetical protein
MKVYVELVESLFESEERVDVDANPAFIFRENFRVANTFPIAFLIFPMSLEFFSIGCISQA